MMSNGTPHRAQNVSAILAQDAAELAQMSFFFGCGLDHALITRFACAIHPCWWERKRWDLLL